ncbi:hypothetical protein [Corynebacterium belfantii]|uniref:hypothetical protein n=1 Tax=Corynebacterium belfantii TaxID=2014537 RepID=UPI00248CF222|nr:hypothetical protein [Corynebacterium belfantii]
MHLNPRKLAATALIIPTLFIAACGSSTPVDENTNDEKHIKGMDKYTAFQLSKQNIEGQLKAPSTAKFQSITDAQIVQSDDKGQWVIRTHVDSENGFGAKIRSEAVCTVRPVDPTHGKVDCVLG